MAHYDFTEEIRLFQSVGGSITVHTTPGGLIGFRMRWYATSESGVARDPQTIEGSLSGWPSAELLRDLIREATGEPQRKEVRGE